MSTSPRKRRKCATNARCATCDGYGRAKHGTGATCKTCNGTGKPLTAPRTIRRPQPGRPSKIATHGDAILKRVQNGMDPDTAASMSSVHPATLERWIARGYDAQTLVDEGYELDEDRNRYHAFLLAFLAARDSLYETLMQGIADDAAAGRMDTRERIAVLERLRSDKWGRRDTVTVRNEPGSNVPMTERYADTLADLLRGILADLALSPEQLERVPVIVERNLERVSARDRLKHA